MAEIDTSSYPKATLPVQKSMLDQAQQFGAMEQQKIGIDRSKLELANKGLEYMTRAMTSLGPNASEQQYLKVGQDAVKMGLVPPNTLHIYEDKLNSYKKPDGSFDSTGFFNEAITAAASHGEVINYHLGNPGAVDTGNGIQPVITSPKPGFGMRSTGLPIARQPGPGQQETDNRRTMPDGSPNPNFGQTLYRGVQSPQSAPGMVTAPPMAPNSPLPVQRNPGPIAPQSDTGITLNKRPSDIIADRFNGERAAAGLPPGVGEAATQAGAASGTVLAAERNKASNFQRDIFPLAQAIPALEKLGTKGTGPGTETVNHLKSFVLSNIPGVTEKDFGLGTVKDFDKAKKYLTDFVNQTGNSGTNDKLAAAFAGNPSVGISNAAAVDVAKSALALRRLQQSKYLAFEDSGLQPDQASRFFANGTVKTPGGASIRVSQIDPRAFGISEMSDKAKKVLLDQLKQNPREMDLFNKSLEIAKEHGYLTPR